jgi:thioredoxin 1
MIDQITSQDFDEEVLKSNLPVFACFSTACCGTCFALCFVVEDLAAEYNGIIKFVMIDVEKEPQLADRYNILPLPAVRLFHHGKPIKEMVGFQSKAHLKKMLNKLVEEKE